MRIDKFTSKFQLALADAQSLATGRDHQLIEPAHVMVALLDLLGNTGFDPVYGARPLKRAIQHQIENPLAQRILAGDFEPGAKIHVDVKDGAFVFG